MNKKLIFKINNEINEEIKDIIKDTLNLNEQWNMVSQLINNYDDDEIENATRKFFENEGVYNKSMEHLNTYLSKAEAVNEKIINNSPQVYQKFLNIKNSILYPASLQYIDFPFNSICVKFLDYINEHYSSLKPIDRYYLGFMNVNQYRILNTSYLSESHKNLFNYIDILVKLESVKLNLTTLSNILIGINCNYIELNEEGKHNEQ